MKSIKNSKTESNLLKAFAGESQARMRYTFFASVAKKEGFMQISDIFTETANQEKEHAERFFKFLEGGILEITAPFFAGKIGTTAENLILSAEGEYDEWHNLYPAFALTAIDEGFNEIADVLQHICVSEKQHERRYRGFLKNIEEQSVFKKSHIIKWRCRNCGYIHEGLEAPVKCPACAHPQAYFEILAENW